MSRRVRARLTKRCTKLDGLHDHRSSSAPTSASVDAAPIGWMASCAKPSWAKGMASSLSGVASARVFVAHAYAWVAAGFESGIVRAAHI